MTKSMPTTQVREKNLLDTFAQTQIANIKYHEIRESSFLEIATCAFFFGAGALLCKQSGAEELKGRAQLVTVVGKICNVSERNASEMIDSVDRFAVKYALIENIIDKGSAAAERWLNCETIDGMDLAQIVDQYKKLTMFDLGIEGVNEAHEARQQELYSRVDESVSQMRRRNLLILLGVVIIGAVVYLAYYYNWLP